MAKLHFHFLIRYIHIILLTNFSSKFQKENEAAMHLEKRENERDELRKVGCDVDYVSNKIFQRRFIPF